MAIHFEINSNVDTRVLYIKKKFKCTPAQSHSNLNLIFLITSANNLVLTRVYISNYGIHFFCHTLNTKFSSQTLHR